MSHLKDRNHKEMTSLDDRDYQYYLFRKRIGPSTDN